MTGSNKEKEFPITSFPLVEKLLSQEISPPSSFVSKDKLKQQIIASYQKTAQIDRDNRKTPFLQALEKDFEVFSKEGLSSQKVQGYLATSPEAALINDDSSYHLIFVNGIFCNELTLSKAQELPKEVKIIDLKNPASSFIPFLKNLHMKQTSYDIDLMAYLNAAFFTDGVLIHVARGYQLDKPLAIHHFLTEEVFEKNEFFLNKPLFISPKIDVFLSDHAQANISVSHHCQEKIDLFYMPSFSFHLEKNSKLSLDYLLDTKISCHQDLFHTFQKENATYDFTGAVTSCEIGGLTSHSYLMDNKARANIHGASLLSEKAKHYCQIKIHHLAEETFSKQLFRGVINDSGYLNFLGNVIMDPIAQKSEASQLSQNLLLSDEASVVTKPYLEIFADDVKATHGATLSQFNEEELFYLRTRGLSEIESKKLLIDGFVKEILFLMKTPSIVKSVLEAKKVPFH